MLKEKLFYSSIYFILLNCMSLFLLCGYSSAQNIDISAWLDNDKIIVQAAYNQSTPASDTHITVFDSVTKKELLKGNANEKGQFIFTVPDVVREGHGLLIEVTNAHGQRNEWNMDASELYAAASLTAGFDEARIGAAQNSASQQKSQISTINAQPNMPMPANQLTLENLKPLIKEVLEVQLEPIRKEIAAQKSSGFSMTEIIGGIGWIIGLTGIIFFFMAKRKNT